MKFATSAESLCIGLDVSKIRGDKHESKTGFQGDFNLGCTGYFIDLKPIESSSHDQSILQASQINYSSMTTKIVIEICFVVEIFKKKIIAKILEMIREDLQSKETRF
jgi:hypothetical protein